MTRQEELYAAADQLGAVALDWQYEAYCCGNRDDAMALMSDADLLVDASVALVARADGWR